MGSHPNCHAGGSNRRNSKYPLELVNTRGCKFRHAQDGFECANISNFGSNIAHSKVANAEVIISRIC